MKSEIAEITRAMSTAIAPVFLITGISALLAAMSNRYGRVIDHTRALLKEDKVSGADEARQARIDIELRRLYGRARLLRTTIILSAISIFFVVVTVFVIFLTMLLELPFPEVVAILFGLALIILIIAVALFIEDFATSLKGLKFEIHSRLKRDVIEND